MSSLQCPTTLLLTRHGEAEYETTTWADGDLEPRIPGGESGTELVARARAVLGEIADLHPGETVLVVSHGGLLYLAVTALCRMQARPARLGNCDLVEVSVDADDWACTAWG